MSEPTHLRRHLSWADHPGRSRNRLGPGVYGSEHDKRCDDMQQGSQLLLRRLWQSHQRIMLVAKAHGRNVVQP